MYNWVGLGWVGIVVYDVCLLSNITIPLHPLVTRSPFLPLLLLHHSICPSLTLPSPLLSQYHKLVYAEDVLLLNDYNRDYNAESEGPKILCIALPAGETILSRLSLQCDYLKSLTSLPLPFPVLSYTALLCPTLIYTLFFLFIPSTSYLPFFMYSPFLILTPLLSASS